MMPNGVSSQVTRETASLDKWVHNLDRMKLGDKVQIRGDARELHIRSGFERFKEGVNSLFSKKAPDAHREMKTRIKEGLEHDYGKAVAQAVLARTGELNSFSSGDLRMLQQVARAEKRDREVQAGVAENKLAVEASDSSKLADKHKFGVFKDAGEFIRQRGVASESHWGVDKLGSSEHVTAARWGLSQAYDDYDGTPALRLMEAAAKANDCTAAIRGWSRSEKERVNERLAEVVNGFMNRHSEMRAKISRPLLDTMKLVSGVASLPEQLVANLNAREARFLNDVELHKQFEPAASREPEPKPVWQPEQDEAVAAQVDDPVVAAQVDDPAVAAQVDDPAVAAQADDPAVAAPVDDAAAAPAVADPAQAREKAERSSTKLADFAQETALAIERYTMSCVLLASVLRDPELLAGMRPEVIKVMSDLADAYADMALALTHSEGPVQNFAALTATAAADPQRLANMEAQRGPVDAGSGRPRRDQSDRNHFFASMGNDARGVAEAGRRRGAAAGRGGLEDPAIHPLPANPLEDV